MRCFFSLSSLPWECFIRFLKSELQCPFENWSGINIVIKEMSKREAGRGARGRSGQAGHPEVGPRSLEGAQASRPAP